MKTLIITEKPKVSQRIAYALSSSPKKKRYGRTPYFTLQQNGNEVYVASAAGHLYSLKQDKEGYGFPEFDVSWKPLFEIEKKKSYTKVYIDALKSLSKGVERFIIATDWDIEGELLGFNALKYSCGVSDAKRMRFSTLVSSDLVSSYESLTDVDKGLVEAGEARHIMDWYWGINISRALMHAARLRGGKFSISAGRVQTPALSILVKKERDIASFVPEKFYEIFAYLKVGESNARAQHRHGRFKERVEAEKALDESRTNEGVVTKVEKKEQKRLPPFPFDLGELQSEAFRLFRFYPKRTQDIAQSLYESGLISYPRTSSQKYPAAIGYRRILQALSKIQGFESAMKILEKDRLFPRHGKKEDPAHPAIYPTGLPPKALKPEEEKLFKLIGHRFIAVFGDPAKLLATTIDVALKNQPYFLEGLKVVSKGWIELYPYARVDESLVPEIRPGDRLPVLKLDLKEGATKPPLRHNPASLIRELEDKGLGTKATRAEILDTLYKRRYIRGVPIKATEAGLAVIEALEANVPEIIDEELTRRFEEKVEEIRGGKITMESVLEEARSELKRIIKEFKEKEKDIGGVLTKAFTNTKRRQEVLGACPNCTGELRITRSSRTGKSFVGCSGYPDCRTSFPLPQRAPVSPTEKTCVKCGLPMVNIRLGKKRILKCIDPNCNSKQKR